MKKKTVLFIVGPTAVGKSKLAMMLAKKIGGEIISADSMQVYKGMDIGTAKPSKADQKKVKHHLIDITLPSKNYSVYDFRSAALKAIRAILKKKKIPIVCGGSGLYVRSLLQGLSEHPGENELIRSRLYQEAEEKGLFHLYTKLKEIDPVAAEKTLSTNLRRIVRALEVYESSGKRISDWHGNQKKLRDYGYEPVVIGINRGREELYSLINQRVDAMFKKGLYKEVQKLAKMKLSKTASQAVGYKEILDVIAGRSNLDTAKDLIKRNTRRFAKRQITWFKREEGITWFQLDSLSFKHCVSNILQVF